MSRAAQRATELSWVALGGVHGGVLAGLGMVGWFLLSSSLLQQPTWTVPNLIAALVNGDAVLRRGFGSGSLVGLALVLVAAGTLGAAFALLTWRVSHRRRLLLGILVGLAAYYATQALMFRKLGAVAWVYASPRSLLVAHLLWGALLGWQARAPVPKVPGGAVSSSSDGEAPGIRIE
ncbi:MAG: hypothetical protein RMI94_02400 [Bryobacterales bacterium]|nr:hypothetical protein [Bryobacteraceae bacterium]MDW8129370.1 hypothetical protein [Bryobacterales bacterium]